ncbi:MAG: Fic family protein [bacterium]|nr:Fic family protein [bacterium]
MLAKQKTNLNQKTKEDFFVDLIFLSSVCEGVQVKKGEIEEVVKGPKKGSQRPEILQAYGQKEVLGKIEKWAQRKSPVTIDYLLKIHKITFGKIDLSAGSYRTGYVKLRNSALMAALPFSINQEMHQFNQWLTQEQKNIKGSDKKRIILLTAKSYHEITRIHPFNDGNGRSARLFINLLLRKYDLPYIIIPKTAKVEKMKTALREADMGEIGHLVNFIGELLKESQKRIKLQ